MRLFDVLDAQKRYIILYGGTRAGKTYAILQYLAYHAATHANKRINVVSISFPHLRRGALEDFKRILQASGYYYQFFASANRFLFANGTYIEFFSVDKAPKQRGAQRDILFINEANLLPYDAFNELDARTRERVFMDFNPTARFWLNDFYAKHENKEDFSFIRRTYKHNPYLDPRQIAAIESRRNDERWWRVYGEGRWGESQGRAFTNFKVVDHIPPQAKLAAVGIDFGLSVSPTAVVEVLKSGSDLYAREVHYSPQTTLTELISLLYLRYKNHKNLIIVADSAQKDLIIDLRKANIPVAPSKKLTLRASYAILNSLSVKIEKSSENLISEAYSVEWASEDKLYARNDHALDALRYAIHAINPVRTYDKK